ncbi:MAG TPA: hypothetical protein PKE55_11385 [Kiritimatiellia bacterium]|nr:hypothetical protein [Kiritimatiellia bacterium]
MPTPLELDPVEVLISRLPAGDPLPLPDVVVALNRHRDVVEGWLLSGEVSGIDLGGGGKSYWVIGRESLIAFLRRRALGLRAPAEHSLAERQLELFPAEEPNQKGT